MSALRILLITLFVLASPLALSACSGVRADKNVETDPPSEAIGKGPGVFTGKRGGLVIYQK